MSLSLNPTPSVAGGAPQMRVMASPPSMRESFGDLSRALRQGDVAAAQAAYGDIMKTAPEGMTVPRGSAFEQLGGALAKGDLDAAKAAFGEMVKNGLSRSGAWSAAHAADTAGGAATTPAAPHGALGHRLSVLA